jgi:hypothetical protein
MFLSYDQIILVGKLRIGDFSLLIDLPYDFESTFAKLKLALVKRKLYCGGHKPKASAFLQKQILLLSCILLI